MSTVETNPSPMAQTWADRRGTGRRQPTAGTVYRVERSNQHDATVGLVWNISRTGVSMLLSDEYGCGDTLRGRLATVHEGDDLPVNLQIAHVRKIETGDFFIGAQFDHRLSDEEMRPFLVG